MPHDVTLITTLAVGFVLSFIFGLLAHRLRASPLLGYLIAGIVMGSHTPGFAADAGIAGQLAEIGVMLLMFGVGLHFSVDDLMAVRRIAILGAFGQIVLATLLVLGITKLIWGWSLGAGLVLGLCLSVASTVVLLKAMEERNAITTTNGRIAIGWLIVEDVAMVMVLVLLPAFAGAMGGHIPVDGHGAAAASHGLLLTLGITLAKVGAFVAVALLLGPRIMPWLLRQVARTGSRELFTLCVLTVALGIAYAAAKFFGVSYALGAFFAGMVLSESELSHKAAANSLPLQDAFAVLFFVSVGMLFDPSILWREPTMVCAVLLLVIIGKSLAAIGIVWILGFPISTTLTVSASLAQIGEFSFILAGIGVSYGLLPPEGFNLVLAAALISITLNPLIFGLSDRLLAMLKLRPKLWERLETNRGARLGTLKADLDAARAKAELKAAAHRTLTPDELGTRFPLFAGLNQEQREVLLLHFHPVEADPGVRVIRTGDVAEDVYFILKGAVEVRLTKRKIKLSAGDVFGEMALISGQPRSADVVTLDYCRFAVLSQRDFRLFLRKYPDVREQITELAAKREETNRQLDDQTVE